MSGHTPGPWFMDSHGRIWRRHPSELYQNGGGVAGDRALANVNRGWFKEGEEGYPVDANARLIAAAPDLLVACQALLERYRIMVAADGPECMQAISAIAKAKGDVK